MRLKNEEIVYLDGSYGEGGGQIIRTAVSLAVITGRTVQIKNIRAGRSKPGLKAQHLTSVRAAGALCDATIHGADLGSSFLNFEPGDLSKRDSFTFDVGTAGAVGLVAQTLLVPLGFLPNRPVTVTVQGGTHVSMAPPADYIEHIYIPMLAKLGVEADFSTSRAGFFPKGGGLVQFGSIDGWLLTPLNCLERGKLKRFQLIITTSQLPEHVAARGEETILKELKGYGVGIEVSKRDLQSHGPGAAVVLIAECENVTTGYTGLGERGKPIERVAMEPLREFQKWFQTCAGADEHLSDQLVLPCSMIPGESCWTTPQITEHLRTALHITQQFLPIEYSLEDRSDGTGLVRLTGAITSGYFNPQQS